MLRMSNRLQRFGLRISVAGFVALVLVMGAGVSVLAALPETQPQPAPPAALLKDKQSQKLTAEQGAALVKAHKNALTVYKKTKDPVQAIAVLEAAGVTATGLDAIFEKKPAGLKEAAYVALLNDYGFFLLETGDRWEYEAGLVLQKVLEIAPDRAVAHLNMGDWYKKAMDTPRESAPELVRDESRPKMIAHYQRYAQLTTGGKSDQKLPARVREALEVAKTEVIYPAQDATVPFGQYRLIEGKDCELCKVYEASLPHRDCPISVSATTPELQEPHWVEKDLMQWKEILNEAENVLMGGWSYAGKGVHANPKDVDDRYRTLTQYGLAHLWETQVDIDNDGQPDQVMRFEDGNCFAASFWGNALLVPGPVRTALNITKTRRLAWGYQWHVYHVFTYKGETYIGVWAYPYEVYIVQSKDGRAKRLCRFQQSLPWR